MSYKIIKSLFFWLMCCVLLPGALLGDGLILIEPWPDVLIEPMRLNVKYHHVTVAIDHQVATTEVDQVFENPYDHSLAGIYIFPVPEQANINNFTIHVDGEPLKTTILAKEKASAAYESLVQKHKDPALLEFIGSGMVQAHISTIGAHQSIRINLKYTELLTTNSGTITYRYSLGTEKFSAQLLDNVSIDVDIKAPQKILNVYSPTHKIAVTPKEKVH